jgi:hypothetical protein
LEQKLRREYEKRLKEKEYKLLGDLELLRQDELRKTQEI